jgi:hypothetical protein
MSASVGGTGTPLEQPPSFQLVDQRHHATGGDPHGPAECLLGLALGRGDVAQQHDVAGIDAQRSARSGILYSSLVTRL